MAAKPLYTVIAVVGIAAASGAAWWYQNKGGASGTAKTPTAASGTATAPAGGASAPARPPAVEVARVELMAVIQALQALKRPCAVTLYLDSQYVLKGITEWLPGWKAKGWRTAGKQPVKNAELWKQLDELVHGGGHTIDWRWVRGHNGDAGNERADALANLGVEIALGRRAPPGV